ncbi:MAG: hypothetical protein J6S14_22825 [Clostridia bacterium]|nr:hypothetical protein [Clostridia bacterium]
MKLIIDIPEEDYNNIEPFLNGEAIKGGFNLFNTLEIIKNGIPLDKHDEEIIATTVESIWGKPPYTELLDKIRAEIEHLTITEGGEDYTRKMAELYSLKIKVLQIIDKYRNEVSE